MQKQNKEINNMNIIEYNNIGFERCKDKQTFIEIRTTSLLFIKGSKLDSTSILH